MCNFKCSVEPCISIKQAAEIFNVSIVTIKRWLRSGELKGFKTSGGHWRTTVKDCKELIKKGANY